MSSSESGADRGDRIPPEYRVRIESYDGAPDVCTIFDASIPRRTTTTWISAEEGSYVSLEAMR